MKTIRLTFLTIVLLSVATLQGCGGGGPDDPPPAVTIRNINGTYYMVNVNMSGLSHYEFGRQYALQIKSNVPNFESLIDSALQATVNELNHADPHIDFNELNTRAHAIYGNVLPDYQQEIQGMQSVFSSTDDTLGNGRLSQNKLLIYELFPDVARAVACSASAAFGSGTTTGNTILGRNLEWDDDVFPYISPLQAVLMMHNGSQSVVLFGFVGQLYAVSGFNASKIFAAILDSDVLVQYQLTGGERSYPMDLRYALENQTTLQGIKDYLTGKKYSYGFNIFLADQNTAAVFEDDVTVPFSGLMTATSALKTGTTVPIPAWNFSNAIALVNWFTLPGTSDNTDFWLGNPARWSSFITRYTNAFAGGGKVNIDVMKQITGYPGPNNNGKGTEGAIWRYNDEGESNAQSIIMDMGTLETWVSFQPVGPALQRPNYIQVFAGNPF